jgi:hypothetical protein
MPGYERVLTTTFCMCPARAGCVPSTVETTRNGAAQHIADVFGAAAVGPGTITS